MTLAPTMEARARMRARLGLDSPPTPGPAKPGEPLTDEQEAILAGLIAGSSDASHGAIARQFAARTGRKLAECTVQARRGPRLAVRSLRPLSPDQAATLTEIVQAAGPRLVRDDVIQEFEARVGRPVSRQTVTAYATQIHGPRRLREAGRPARRVAYNSASSWPAWTDQVRFDIAAPATPGGGR